MHGVALVDPLAAAVSDLHQRLLEQQGFVGLHRVGATAIGFVLEGQNIERRVVAPQ